MRNCIIITALLTGLTVDINAQQAKPKLVVGIIVDQMRTDYIYRYWNKFGEGGFKRLVNEGFFCRNAHFNYIPTYTGPGHASVYTGATPMIHGIIANDWYDRTLNAEVYCVADASVKVVGSNAEGHGMSPHRLLAPTMGDALRITSNFKGKSIGISIKDRGAVLPAGHSANAAYWMDYGSGAMVSSTYYMPQLPAWVAEFNKEKHADDLVKDGWVPLLALPLYTESTADDTPYESSLVRGGKPTFPYNVAEAIKAQGYKTFACTPMGNTLLRLFAEETIINEDLGADEYTDLLALSFSSTDIIGHAYGPQSIEVEDTYLRLDQEIDRLMKALDQRVGAGNYVLFLTADHAAAQQPQYLIDHKIPVGFVDETAFKNDLAAHLGGVFGQSLILSYSNQQLFLDHAAMRQAGIDPKKVYDEVRTFALAFKGVCNVLDIKQLQHPLPPDRFSELAQKGWNPQRSGDILIQYLPGWMDSYNMKGGTTHGSSYNYDTHVPLLFFGFGVPHGESTEPVTVTQIVPTVSMICRVAFPDAAEVEPVGFGGSK